MLKVRKVTVTGVTCAYALDTNPVTVTRQPLKPIKGSYYLPTVVRTGPQTPTHTCAQRLNLTFACRYPDSWYQDITSNKKFFSLAATFRGGIVGMIVAEIKGRTKVHKEVHRLEDVLRRKGTLSLSVWSLQSVL